MGVLTRIKKQEIRASSTRQKDVLKVVHPHRYVQIFREPITAGELMRRYPRHCIARPDFFEFPWIVVRPESILVPGKVFYLVPYHTIYTLLKAKTQQLDQSLINLPSKQIQSPKLYNFYRKYNSQKSTMNTTYQQEDTYYKRQLSIDHEYSQEQDSNNIRYEYKTSFYELWNKIREALINPHEERYDCLYSEHDTPLYSLTRSGQPQFSSPEHVEFQKLKSCLRREDSDRKKLDLKVSFLSPVDIYIA